MQQIKLKVFLMIQSKPFAFRRWVNGPRDHSNLHEVPAQDTAKHRPGSPELARLSLYSLGLPPWKHRHLSDLEMTQVQRQV